MVRPLVRTIAVGILFSTILISAEQQAVASTPRTDVRRRAALEGARALRNRYRDRHDYELYSGPGGGPRPPLAPETNRPLNGRKVYVPMIFPLIGAIHGPHDNYNVSRGSYRHTAIDITAPKMTPIVAPFSGLLGFKTQSFWIFGDNRYKCLGTHLNDDTPGTRDNRSRPDFMFAPNLRPGDRVVAGQLIGYVGDSGNATGPHLHFELFAPDGVLVSPYMSLSGAQRIPAPRPVVSGRAGRPAPGEMRIDGCVRKWDPAHSVLTLLLVSRQISGGKAVAYTRPTWYRLTLPRSIVDSVDMQETLTLIPRDRTATFYVAAHAPINGKPSPVGASGVAHRLILPVAGSIAVLPGRTPAAPAETLPAISAPATAVTAPTTNASESAPADLEFADFEDGSYNGWTLEGNCWGDSPTAGDTFGRAIRGYNGERFLCTFHPRFGGMATGTATSQDFTIQRPYINFLIGGGNLPGDGCINLIVDDRIVRTATGNNRRTLAPASWDVRSIIGRRAYIEILDRSEVNDIGYIMVDDIRFSAHSR